MLEYLFIAFIVIFCIQLIYNILIFGAFSFSKKKVFTTQFSEPISVIICAKNEANNLKINLPYFLNQDYPNFELVLINDGSYDETLEVIENFKNDFPTKIKIVDVAENEQFWGSKKYALTLGIKAASNDYMLFSDADCKPNSKQWISEMTAQFKTGKTIVLGYGSYQKISKSLLNKLVRYETLLTAIQYFSYAKIGFPYMGVGRNLAYTKPVFFEAKGFVKHIRIKSGDDDLFVNEVANKKNTAICFSENSFTESVPKKSFKTWILQKRRHVSTANHYKIQHKFSLALYYFSKISFWLLALLLISFQYHWEITTAIILLKIIVLYSIIWTSAKKLNEKDLILFSPFFEIFLVFIQMFIFIKNLISKPAHW